jgi:hypothetical protein
MPEVAAEETTRQRIEREAREQQERNRARSEARKAEQSRIVGVIARRGDGPVSSFNGREYIQDGKGTLRRSNPKQFSNKKQRVAARKAS